MDIVIIPFHDYKKWLDEGFRTRDAHLFQHFQKQDSIGKVLVINRPVSIAEMIVKRKRWDTYGGKVVFSRKFVQLSQMKKNVWCMDFLLFDFIKVILQKKLWWSTAFNYDKVTQGIHEALTYLQMHNSVLFLQNPMAVGIVKKLKISLFAFDAIDNWLYHPQMKAKKVIAANYNYIDKHADVITTVSDALRELFHKNKNIYWIPNGVDSSFFEGAQKSKKQELSVTIGYVGKIQDRIDFDLVESCLNQCPNYKFIFIGPVYSQKKRIQFLEKKYKNIVFRGDVHYLDLPEVLKNIDIAIIPHKINPFTNSMNPLKLYEYLAAGKFVVSTGIAGADKISPYVYIADNSYSFVNAIKKAVKYIELGRISCKEIAASIPAECQWSNRAKAILKLFEDKLTFIMENGEENRGVDYETYR